MYLINIDEIIASAVSNTNGDKNTYSVKFLAQVGQEQAAGNYLMNIKYGLKLNY